MANSTSMNDLITDSVSQNVTLLTGIAAPQGMAMLDVVSADTLGMVMHNAVSAQQNAQITANASITTSCAKMLNIQPAITPPPTPKVPPPFMSLTPSGTATEQMKLINAVETMIKELKNKPSTNQNVQKTVDQATSKLKELRAIIPEDNSPSAAENPSPSAKSTETEKNNSEPSVSTSTTDPSP